jgi:hypothetical protein
MFFKKGAGMHQKGGQCPILSEKEVPAKFTIPKCTNRICAKSHNCGFSIFIPDFTMVGGFPDRYLLYFCHMPPSYVPYKGTYVPYDGTFGTPDQGQMLDVWESQTTGSALRWLAPYRSTSYSWSCSWSYSWSYSWTHVLGTKTMTSLILDHVAMGYLYLGTSTEIKICSWNCLRTRLW